MPLRQLTVLTFWFNVKVNIVKPASSNMMRLTDMSYYVRFDIINTNGAPGQTYRLAAPWIKESAHASSQQGRSRNVANPDSLSRIEFSLGNRTPPRQGTSIAPPVRGTRRANPGRSHCVASSAFKYADRASRFLPPYPNVRASNGRSGRVFVSYLPHQDFSPRVVFDCPLYPPVKAIAAFQGGNSLSGRERHGTCHG